MKVHPFLFGVILLICSCRKDPEIEINIPQEPEPFELVTTTGSWWKYDWYQVDSLGNETLTVEKDCLYVAGDTLINGNTYTHFKGDYHVLTSKNWYWRDSLNYIVNASGKVLFSTVMNYDTLSVFTSSIYNNYTICSGVTSVKSVPAGTFEVYDSQIHYWNVDGTPFTNCNSSWIKHQYFSNGIGIISSQTGYVFQIQQLCSYDESRLTDYYIAP